MGRKVSIDLDKEEEQAKVERKGGEEREGDYIDYDDFI